MPEGSGGRSGELAVAASLVATIVACACLVVVYARGGNVQLEGVGIAVACGGLAVGLGLWAKRFMPGGEAVEERHDLASTDEEVRAFAADFERGEQLLTRRGLLLALLGSGITAIGVVALLPFRSLGPRPLGALRTTGWRRGTRLVDESGNLVRRDQLDVDGVLTVFPEGYDGNVTTEADSQVILIRLRDGELRPRPGRESWAPDGNVAYSKVCTHAGCPVGLYDTRSHQLVCPCHQSLFDVIDGARPVFGPATRSLPQLPLSVDADGHLVADGDFPEPIGPAFWSRG